MRVAVTLLLAVAWCRAAETVTLPALLDGIQKSCASRHVNPGHGFTVLPVAQAILSIKTAIPEIQPADEALVQVAALLHDIGGGGPPGEVKGPPIARDVLTEQKCASNFIDSVCRIIATHHHLKGEKGTEVDTTPEWFVVVVADRPPVIKQHQRAPDDKEGLIGMVRATIATLKRDLR